MASCTTTVGDVIRDENRLSDCLGQHNDSRMNISLVMTAVQHGAVMANHVEVTKLHKKMVGAKDTERICAATLQDRLTGEEWVVRCRVSSKTTYTECN